MHNNNSHFSFQSLLILVYEIMNKFRLFYGNVNTQLKPFILHFTKMRISAIE